MIKRKTLGRERASWFRAFLDGMTDTVDVTVAISPRCAKISSDAEAFAVDAAALRVDFVKALRKFEEKNGE